MCKNVRREGTAKFGADTCIGLEDIARKREGGLEIAPPPSGARVKELLLLFTNTKVIKK